MPHIHTQPKQHDLTVTAYIVRADTQQPQALLHMHRKHRVLLPVGGHVELTETPWQAVAHEVAEESGYALDQLQILQPKSRIHSLSKVMLHPYPLSMNTHDITQDHFHTDIQYGFIANGDPAGVVSAGESADLRWLTKDQIANLPSDQIYQNARETYLFMLGHALNEWEAVNANEFLFSYPDSFYPN